MPRTPTNSSRAGLILSPGSSAFAVIRSVRQIRRTGGDLDRLTTVNAVARLLPLVTSALLVLRRLRGRSRQRA